MHKFRRYLRETPFGYGRKIYFEVNGEGVFGISSLIELTMERFARRFGPVKREDAQAMIRRMAFRESASPELTIRKFIPANCLGMYEFPSDLRRHELYLIMCPEKCGKFSAIEDWDKIRSEYKSKIFKQIEKDRENLRDCSRLLKQIKGVMNEGSKDNRTVA